jgi:hypothetical protein
VGTKWSPREPAVVRGIIRVCRVYEFPVPVNLRRLRSDLNRLSKDTWGRLLAAEESHISFGETTITDVNLLWLKQRNPALELRQFNQNEEQETGADWAWWIGSDPLGWVGMHFQAKRSRINADYSLPQYMELGHYVKSSGLRQWQVLEKHALAYGAIPYYLFYNGWSTRIGMLAGSIDRRMGCAAARSQRVISVRARKPRPINEVSHYLPVSVPWADVLLGPEPAKGKRTAPELGPWLATIATGDFNTSSNFPGLQSKLPDYVFAARERSSSSDVSASWPRTLLVLDIGDLGQ